MNNELIDWRLEQTEGALVWEPDHEFRWIERAEVLAQSGDLKGALAACSQGIARQPFCGRLYKARAEYAEALGFPEEAAADHNLALLAEKEGYR